MSRRLIGPTLLIAAGVLLFYKAPGGGPVIGVISAGLVVLGLLRLGRGG